MPAVLMNPVSDRSAWRGKDLAGDPSWIVRLDAEDIEELAEGLRRVDAAGLALDEIGAADFPLPRVGVRLKEWLAELQTGRGFLLVRGFPVDRYPIDAIRRMYRGLSVHLGELLSQNSYGDLIGDIRDEGAKLKPGELRRNYGSTRQLRFHSDRADIVGLLCLRAAREGGLSCLISSMTLYNEILAHHPEYLPALYDGFAFINSEEGGDGSWWRVPMYTIEAGVLSSRLSRNALERARAAGIPFSDLEIAALEYIDELTARDALKLDMEFEPGDMQFINNFTILHARTPYSDDRDPAGKRHLLRVWIKPETRRPLGPYYSEYDGVPKILERAVR